MSDINALFRRRIGISEKKTITFEALNNVLEKTSKTIPFENLSIIDNKTSDISKQNIKIKGIKQSVELM